MPLDPTHWSPLPGEEYRLSTAARRSRKGERPGGLSA
jgi:hypothetical protein